MLTSYSSLIILIVQTVLVYFLSRQTINEFFYFLRFFFKNDHIVYTVISVLFLPGTIIHEMGHFLAATILMLRVYNVHIFPQWEKNQIKLGSVVYEKKDVIRGIFVGVAPLFFALVFYWLLAKLSLFPNNENLWLEILFGYIVFAVSSTMFSSKQDLVDFAFVIPLIIIMIGLLYIFDIKINFILDNQLIINRVIDFFKIVNFYLFFSLMINLVLIAIFKSFRFLYPPSRK